MTKLKVLLNLNSWLWESGRFHLTVTWPSEFQLVRWIWEFGKFG